MPALGLYMAGVPDAAARALAGGIAGFSAFCFAVRQGGKVRALLKRRSRS